MLVRIRRAPADGRPGGLGAGEAEVGEVLAGGEGAGRADGYAVPDQARAVRRAARDLGAEVRLPADGDVVADGRGPEGVPADGAGDMVGPDPTHGRAPLHVRSLVAFPGPCLGRLVVSKRQKFTIAPPPPDIILPQTTGRSRPDGPTQERGRGRPGPGAAPPGPGRHPPPDAAPTL